MQIEVHTDNGHEFNYNEGVLTKSYHEYWTSPGEFVTSIKEIEEDNHYIDLGPEWYIEGLSFSEICNLYTLLKCYFADHPNFIDKMSIYQTKTEKVLIDDY